VKVWLLTEDRGHEHEQVGLYSSQAAAREALSALAPDAEIQWREGGVDSITLAFLRGQDELVRRFQVYPLELESEPQSRQDRDPAPDGWAEPGSERGGRENGSTPSDSGAIADRATQPVAV
jgi:hypothetical protein